MQAYISLDLDQEHAINLTLCLVRVKRRGKTRERGKCYFPPFGSTEKTEGRENRGENKSLGPTKIHLPKLGRKQRREKALILKSGPAEW